VLGDLGEVVVARVDDPRQRLVAVSEFGMVGRLPHDGFW
jgi:hypothetical protein